MATSLTAPFTLAQSDSEPDVTLGSQVTPGDAEAIEAAVDAMPLSTSTVLDALSEAARTEVERICLPVQYQSGAVAYRECISAQLAGQPSSSTAIVPATSLSFDEEYAIQQTCQSAGAVDSSAYRACDEAELANLAGVPEPALDRITEDETYAVQLGCYSSQSNDGVRAYRECLNESIGQLLALPRPDLSTLTLVERNALQLRCSAQNTSAVAYRNCLLDAVDSATVEDRIANSSVDASTTQNDIELSSELSPELSPEPLAEPSAELSLEPASEPSEQVAPPTDDAVSSQLATLPEELAAAPVTDMKTPEVITPVAETDPTMNAQAIRLPTTDRSGESDSSRDTDALSDTPEDTDELAQPPADLWTRVQNTMIGMSDMTRMLMWTAIGLPILLTLFWLFMRSRQSAPEYEDSYPENSINNGVDTTPLRSSAAHRMRMTDDDTAEFIPRNRATERQLDNSDLSANDDDELNFTAQMDELFGKSTSARVETVGNDTGKLNATTLDMTPEVVLASSPMQERRPTTEKATILPIRPAPVSVSARQPETTAEPVSSQKPQKSAQRLSVPDNDSDPDLDPDLDINSDADLPSAENLASEPPASKEITLIPATERDDYLAWLSVQDETKQQTLAIEFLIYWMAYSDERYSPELKKKIFQLKNPGDHELIKRWTLKQDVHAFAGNLQWLQYNLSTEQHEQIINLLMALLVSENALTPAQNTLLRFLADAFGLGAERLDVLFQTGFAQPMPPLPELDSPDWWKRQTADDLKRWDARSVSRQRSEIRYRVALGLPFAEELDSENIMASFSRAASRCQPERFNRLSSREQYLVAKQLEKYEMAAESLLEVSA